VFKFDSVGPGSLGFPDTESPAPDSVTPTDSDSESITGTVFDSVARDHSDSRLSQPSRVKVTVTSPAGNLKDDSDGDGDGSSLPGPGPGGGRRIITVTDWMT
jgi:hypothetical protein